MAVKPESEIEAKKDVLVAKMAFLCARESEMSWQEFMEEELEEHVEILKDKEDFDDYYEWET